MMMMMMMVIIRFYLILSGEVALETPVEMLDEETERRGEED